MTDARRAPALILSLAAASVSRSAHRSADTLQDVIRARLVAVYR